MSFQLNYVRSLNDGVNKTVSNLCLCKTLYNMWTLLNLNLSNPKWKEWMLKAPSDGDKYPPMRSCLFPSYFLFLNHRYQEEWFTGDVSVTPLSREELLQVLPGGNQEEAAVMEEPRDQSAKAQAIAKNILALAPTTKGKIKAQKCKRTLSVEEEYDSKPKKSSTHLTPPAPHKCGHPHKEGTLFLCHSLFHY